MTRPLTMLETCLCGEWPISDYGRRCPSCPPPITREQAYNRGSLAGERWARGWLMTLPQPAPHVALFPGLVEEWQRGFDAATAEASR